jgi:replication initiator protein RepSA
MLGYRGHFATKSRRYSTTMRALRAARRNWKRRQHHPATHQGSDKTVLTLTDLEWAGRGWRTAGDALLALSAAALARDHDRAARDEARAA